MANEFINSLGVDIEVTGADNLKKSLNKSEKAYLGLDKSIKKVTKSLQEESKETKETAENEEKVNKKSKRKRGRFSEGLVKMFNREKEAAEDAGFSIKKFTGLVGGGALIGAAVASARSFLSWDNQLGDLRATLKDAPGEVEAAGESIMDLSAILGVSRQELIQTTKQMGDLNLAGKDVALNSPRFEKLRETITHLSSAMDVSSGEVVDFADNFKRIYKLPHHRLRGIAASMKFIQESTSMTGQEVLSFAKSVDNLMARMTGNPEARADALRDFTAIAAAFKDQGVNAEAFPRLFTEALKENSDKGRAFLNELSAQTGHSMDTIRDMIKSGGVEGATDLVIASIKKLGREGIEHNEEYYESIFDMSAENMFRIIDLDEKRYKTTLVGAKKAERDQAKVQEAAESRLNKLSQQWNTFKRFFEDIWLALGRVVARVVTSLFGSINHLKDDAIFLLQEAFAWFESPEGKASTTEWAEKAESAIKTVGEIFVWAYEKVKEGIEWWDKLSESNKKLLKGLALALVAFKVLGPAISGMGLGGIAAGLVAIYLGAKKIADWVDQQQGEDQRRATTARETQNEINTARGFMDAGGGKFKKFERTDDAEIGAIKAMLGGGGRKEKLLTATGKIDHYELERRLSDAFDDPDVRAKRRKNWIENLQAVQKSPNFNSALASRYQQIKKNEEAANQQEALQSAAVADVPTVPNAQDAVSVKPPTVPDQKPQAPQVVAVKDSGSTDAHLSGIHATMKQLGRQMSALKSSPHASRAEIAKAMGT